MGRLIFWILTLSSVFVAFFPDFTGDIVYFETEQQALDYEASIEDTFEYITISQVDNETDDRYGQWRLLASNYLFGSENLYAGALIYLVLLIAYLILLFLIAMGKRDPEPIRRGLWIFIDY